MHRHQYTFFVLFYFFQIKSHNKIKDVCTLQNGLLVTINVAEYLFSLIFFTISAGMLCNMAIMLDVC